METVILLTDCVLSVRQMRIHRVYRYYSTTVLYLCTSVHVQYTCTFIAMNHLDCSIIVSLLF